MEPIEMTVDQVVLLNMRFLTWKLNLNDYDQFNGPVVTFKI